MRIPRHRDFVGAQLDPNPARGPFLPTGRHVRKSADSYFQPIARAGCVWHFPPGDDEKQVFEELCSIVDEVIEIYKRDNRPLPPPTSGRDYANKMLDVA